MKQTAVEWLALRYHHRQGYLSQEDIEQAKAIEKEQIIKGYEQRRRILQPDEDGIMKFMSGEQYYNETYGGKDL